MSDNSKLSTEAVASLVSLFANIVLTPGSEQYHDELNRFWNLDNASIKPGLIAVPKNAGEVSKIVKRLVSQNIPFGVRSGGYMPTVGMSTSSAVLISTRYLNQIELLADDSLVKVGTGLQWGDIYDVLEPMGLVVAGGRSRPVGVGGFLLHGGVSHFANEYGWSCETVTEYEIVLASGEVIRTNAKDHPELYWALKGGGSNFGIVTAFTLKTYKHPKVWGGTRMSLGTSDTATAILRSIHSLLENATQYPKAEHEVIAIYNPQMCQSGDPMIITAMCYSNPTPFPPEFKTLTDVPYVADTLRITTQRDLGDEEKNFIGYDKRGVFRGINYKSDAELSIRLYEKVFDTIKKSKIFDLDHSAVAGLLLNLVSERMNSGDTVMKLPPGNAPYMSFDLVVRWTDASHSNALLKFADDLIDMLKNEVRQAGCMIEYTYANVAGHGDIVFKGLPQPTQDRLASVSKDYDPNGVFQKLVSGFRLDS